MVTFHFVGVIINDEGPVLYAYDDCKVVWALWLSGLFHGVINSFPLGRLCVLYNGLYQCKAWQKMALLFTRGA